MKNLISIVLLASFLSTSFLSASAYDFTSDYKARVLSVDESRIQMQITESEPPEGGKPFPIGSVINLSIKEKKSRKRPIRDERYVTTMTSVSLPSGEVIAMDREFDIKPRKFLNVRNAGSTVIGTTGLTLGLVIDGLTVGLPVARGGKALWDMGYEIYDTPKDESKAKNGAKGFILGALFPIPQIFMRGRLVDIHKNSIVFISETDNPEKPVCAFVIRRLN